jgi:hypothetical protein
MACSENRSFGARGPHHPGRVIHGHAGSVRLSIPGETLIHRRGCYRREPAVSVSWLRWQHWSNELLALRDFCSDPIVSRKAARTWTDRVLKFRATRGTRRHRQDARVVMHPGAVRRGRTCALARRAPVVQLGRRPQAEISRCVATPNSGSASSSRVDRSSPLVQRFCRIISSATWE